MKRKYIKFSLIFFYLLFLFQIIYTYYDYISFFKRFKSVSGFVEHFFIETTSFNELMLSYSIIIFFVINIIIWILLKIDGIKSIYALLLACIVFLQIVKIYTNGLALEF